MLLQDSLEDTDRSPSLSPDPSSPSDATALFTPDLGQLLGGDHVQEELRDERLVVRAKQREVLGHRGLDCLDVVSVGPEPIQPVPIQEEVGVVGELVDVIQVLVCMGLWALRAHGIVTIQRTSRREGW